LDKRIFTQTIENIKKRGREPEFPTLPCLDKKIYGLNRGEVTVVGAVSGEGKTAFATQICLELAERKKNVIFISLEMSAPQICERLISHYVGIPRPKVQQNDLNEEDWAKVHQFMDLSVFKEGFDISEGGHLSGEENSSRTDYENIRTLCEQRHPDFIAIDHIQRIRMPHGIDEKRAIKDFVVNMTELAKKQNIPILLLSQLRKTDSSSGPRRPNQDDLKWSGDIANEATTILLLYRPAEHGFEQKEPPKIMQKNNIMEYSRLMDMNEKMRDKSYCEILIVKNRNGERTKVECRFRGDIYKFEEWEE